MQDISNPLEEESVLPLVGVGSWIVDVPPALDPIHQRHNGSDHAKPVYCPASHRALLSLRPLFSSSDIRPTKRAWESSFSMASTVASSSPIGSQSKVTAHGDHKGTSVHRTTNEDEDEDEDEVMESHHPLLRQRLVSSNRTSARILLFVGPALLLSTFVLTADLSYVAANYSRKIADELHQIGNASWIVTGYLITESAFQPTFAHLALLYRSKTALVIAASCMTVGLLLCSFSHHLWQLVVSRAVVGIGAAGLELLVLVTINNLVDLYSLPLWRTATTLVATLASFFGPSAGAILTDRVGSRWVFLLEFFLMLVATAGIIFTLRFPKSEVKAAAISTNSFDYVGTALLLCMVGVPLLAINLGGQVLPWSHPIIIVLFVLTPISIFLFVRSQRYRKQPPLVPLHFLRKKAVVAIFACGLPAWLSWDQLKYGIGQYVQARSMRSTQPSGFADWALSCVFLGIPLGSFLSGIVIRRYHALKSLLRITATFNLLLYVCFAAGLIHPEQPAFAPILIALGLNVGVLDNCWLVAIFAQSNSKAQQASLYAFFDFGRANTGNLGIVVALAATNAMIRSNLHDSLAEYPDRQEIIRKSLESLSSVYEFPVAVQRAVLDSFVRSSERAFAISCAIMAIAVIATFYIPEAELLQGDGDTSSDLGSHNPDHSTN